MCRLLTTLASVALVVGLAAPAWADDAHKPADKPIIALDAAQDLRLPGRSIDRHVGTVPSGPRALATVAVPGSATTTREATQTPAGGHFSMLDNQDQRPHCFRRYNADCDRERRENDRNAQRDDNGY